MIHDHPDYHYDNYYRDHHWPGWGDYLVKEIM